MAGPAGGGGRVDGGRVMQHAVEAAVGACGERKRDVARGFGAQGREGAEMEGRLRSQVDGAGCAAASPQHRVERGSHGQRRFAAQVEM